MDIDDVTDIVRAANATFRAGMKAGQGQVQRNLDRLTAEAMSRDEALNRLRLTLVQIEDGAVREAVYQAAVRYGHAWANEVLDECKRAVRETTGVVP